MVDLLDPGKPAGSKRQAGTAAAFGYAGDDEPLGGCRTPRDPSLGGAQFRKVLASFGAGLFHCYDVEQLPRTNNDLEQYFGSYRIIEQRVTGHKVASVRTVTRGSVRLLAGVSTRSVRFSAADLVPASLPNYYRLRAELASRERPRREQLRFRRKPLEFLLHLGEVSITATLPP